MSTDGRIHTRRRPLSTDGRTHTRTDESFGETVTLRRFYADGEFIRADVFVGGWRSGSYKTDAGAIRAATREALAESLITKETTTS